MAKKSPTMNEVYQDLVDQLKAKNKDTEYGYKMIDIIMDSFKNVRKLTADINKRGVKIEEPNSHGDVVTKDNTSFKMRQQEIATIRSILELFDLQNPLRPKTEDDYL